MTTTERIARYLASHPFEPCYLLEFGEESFFMTMDDLGEFEHSHGPTHAKGML